MSSHQQDYDASGASSVTDGGAAFIFVRNAGVWSQEQRIVATGINARVAYDNFADTVSISGDTLVTSAPKQSYDTSGATNRAGAGAAYVFVRNAGVWSQQQKLIATGTNARVAGDAFGSSLSISGDTIAVGSYVDFTAKNSSNRTECP